MTCLFWLLLRDYNVRFVFDLTVFYFCVRLVSLVVMCVATSLEPGIARARFELCVVTHGTGGVGGGG